ncbi:protein ALP1-like [Odontomachus brunneus]|uniref:protein ALP1-like n=1 Tax=Odontomachus brunneus TaxID=486640 RepID=UPI0013F1B513|nr:protein ALP1-like [Odontomachus brunneus]
MTMDQYLHYRERLKRLFITILIEQQVKRRRIAAVAAVIHHVQSKKRKYLKKKFWIAPIFKNRKKNSFYFASVPKLKLEDLRFRNYFRMSATQFEELLQIVGTNLQKQNVVRESISSSERLALTLRYMASGDSMTSMSYQYLVGVTTVSNIIRETCTVIWDSLRPLVLPGQLQEKDWIDIANGFEKWNFSHCIGAIDGKHVVIQCPNKAGSTYFNYKHSHSIVLMAICDANYIIRFVDIGSYGRRSDGGIFKDSALGKAFDGGHMNVPQPTAISGNLVLPYCLVEDEAFPLKEYLLRPYPNRGLTPEQSVYNYRLSRARRTIENTFGILANQWRIYRKPIIANPTTAVGIVQATVCLHNWLRINDIGASEFLDIVDFDDPCNSSNFTARSWPNVMDGCAFRDITNCGSNASARKYINIRNEFCHYFNEGAVPWQCNRPS